MELKNATILLVDDEPVLLPLFAAWFEREGCRVLTAPDGAAALQIIQNHPVDVVVTDIRMPIMDGIQLLKKTKELNKYEPCVIFISGFTDIAPRDAYDLGVEAILQKPLERKDLISAVSRILAERRTLWSRVPAIQPDEVLDAQFVSLATALSSGQIAFGRGGFCIHSNLDLNLGPVDLLLKFVADNRTVSGNAIVRWVSSADSVIGLEITYLDDDNREWIFDLTAKNPSHSFIPRTAAAPA